MICPLDGEVCEECTKRCKMSIEKALRFWRSANKSRRSQWAKRCPHYRTYKAVFAPRCNGGNPCLSCLAQWANSRFNPENVNYVHPSARTLQNRKAVKESKLKRRLQQSHNQAVRGSGEAQRGISSEANDAICALSAHRS